ncbi:hypothetical protein ILYODFUR_038807 [Ilyodon furcidens]|uniref:Uncharacterized protein n=1 Tax=Ilyodon furcidens TaxID=33524 RepID=A0ABV0V9N9_9TELE
MNTTPSIFKGGERHPSVMSDFKSVYICVLDDLQEYLTTPPAASIIVLHGPGSLYTGQGASELQSCFLMTVDLRCAEMMLETSRRALRISQCCQQTSLWWWWSMGCCAPAMKLNCTQRAIDWFKKKKLNDILHSINFF